MTKRILYIGNDLQENSFTATYISFFSKMLRQEGFEVKTASNSSNKVLRLSEMLGLIKKYHKHADVVLIDTYGATNFYYAYLVGRLCQFYKLPYIPILHGGNLPERLDKDQGLSKNLFNKAFRNISPSQFLYEQFKARNINNLQIIPNAIALANFPFKERQNFKPKLLWVRRFQKRYHPIMALYVFEMLKVYYPEAELCMVGPEKDGSMRKCKRIARNKKLRVNFPGKLSKSEWARLSTNYDFFLNTTSIDNTPISVIEAMALGLPVISTRVGGMPYLIEDKKDGILVDLNNSQQMLKQIVRLIENPKKTSAIAANARKKVENFDWSVIKNDWMSLLNNLD